RDGGGRPLGGGRRWSRVLLVGVAGGDPRTAAGRGGEGGRWETGGSSQDQRPPAPAPLRGVPGRGGKKRSKGPKPRRAGLSLAEPSQARRGEWPGAQVQARGRRRKSGSAGPFTVADPRQHPGWPGRRRLGDGLRSGELVGGLR